MAVLDTKPGERRLLDAALLAGTLVAVVFLALGWARLLVRGGVPARTAAFVRSVAVGWVLATASFVALLLAVLVVVAEPSGRRVAGGAILVYGVDLLLTVGQTTLGGFPGGIRPTILAVPLARVVRFLAVATAVWLAYHGGYERLVEATGDADQHPLVAVVGNRRIGAGLSLQRGVVAAGLAALVGSGGLVLAGWIGDLLRSIAYPGAGASSAVFRQVRIWSVGIAPGHLPEEWLFEASFLLAVLFVTGPRVDHRNLLKGLAVVFGVQSTATLSPALLPPFRPVDLWGPSGPVLMPLGDALLLVGIATAVWLGFHGGMERLGT
jgi:hypothetical protein